MKSKKALTLAVLMLTAALIIPLYVPTTSAQEPRYLLPTDPEFIHLDKIPPVLEEPTWCQQWHEIYPEYCNIYGLTNWVDRDESERIDFCDYIALVNKETTEKRWYHVEWVTVTIKVENVTGGSQEIMYLEFDGTLDEWMTTYQYAPISTWWHQIYPKDQFSNWLHITSWEVDSEPVGVLSPSDVIDFEQLPMQFWHVLELKTDLIVSVPPPNLCAITETKGATFFEVVPDARENIVAAFGVPLQNTTAVNISDPICSNWTDTVGNEYHLQSWEDTARPVITDTWHGDNETTTFMTSKSPVVEDSEEVYVNETLMTKDENYTINYSTGNITFTTAPENCTEVKATYEHKVLSPSDQIDLYLKPDGPKKWYHVDDLEYGTICNMTVSEKFTIDINITNAPATPAWGLTLRFNPAVLKIVDVQQGGFLPGGLMGVAYNNTEGWLRAECTLIGPGSASGNGTLISITFYAIACGTSKLDLQDTFLLDTDLVRTYYPNNDGFFVADCPPIGPIHDLTIMDVVVSPREAQQGDSVSIDVLVVNTGNYTQHLNLSVYADMIVYDELTVYPKVNATPGDPDRILVGDEILIGTNACYVDLDPGENVTVHFDWDTTKVPGENYTISAELFKPDDDDPNDNKFISDIVWVRCEPDIEVTEIEILTPKVRTGENALVNVTATNEGKTPATFNIYLHLNGTQLVPPIGVINLPPQKSREVTFVFKKPAGVYFVSATVDILPLEKDYFDNKLYGGILIVWYDDPALVSCSPRWVPLDFNPNPPETGVEGGCKIAYFNVTVTNNGTDWCKVMIYWYVQNVTPVANPAADLTSGLVGLLVGVFMEPGATYTFSLCSVYGGWATKERALYPPFYAQDQTTYVIIAEITKLYYDDDNLANNMIAGCCYVHTAFTDVDENGAINVLDLIDVLVMLGCPVPTLAPPGVTPEPGQCEWPCPPYNTTDPGPCECYRCDVDHSGGVNVLDLIKVLTTLGMPGWNSKGP